MFEILYLKEFGLKYIVKYFENLLASMAPYARHETIYYVFALARYESKQISFVSVPNAPQTLLPAYLFFPVHDVQEHYGAHTITGICAAQSPGQSENSPKPKLYNV